MADDVFCAAVPEANPLVPVDDINTHRQLFQGRAKKFRIIEKVGRHGRRTPPSGSSAKRESTSGSENTSVVLRPPAVPANPEFARVLPRRTRSAGKRTRSRRPQTIGPR